MKLSKILAASVTASAALSAGIAAADFNGLYIRQDGSSSTTSSSSSSASDTSSSDTSASGSSTDSSSGSSTDSSTESSTESSSESSTTDDSTSSTEESSSESSSTEETSSTSESTSETSTSESSATETTGMTTSPSTTYTPAGSLTPTAPATPSVLVGTFPTQCDVVRIPLSDEDAVLLGVLFGDRLNTTSTYADWLLSYGSNLVSQIEMVIGDSEVDPGLQFTTAFDDIDIPGILGLASAAPIYTCYLSSMWAEALANPGANVKRDVQRGYYAKRALPTEEEKTKLLVLFERRETNGVEFSYAEYLSDETQELLSEIREVIGGQAANPSAYTSLFSVLDIRQLLSVVSQAPIYTQGLSAAFQTALASHSASLTTRPTSAVLTESNPPTFSTSYANADEALRSTLSTVTQHVTSTQFVGTATEVVTSDVAGTPGAQMGYESTRRVTVVGAAATRTVTIYIDYCATLSSQAAAAVTTTVRVEEFTGTDGRVTRRTVTETICDDYCSSLFEEVSRRATTTTVIYEIQTRNAAIRNAAALGLGIFGYFAFFL